jgi:hypothetical protein
MTGMVRWRNFGAALFVLAISVAFLLWAQSYPRNAGGMPVLVAWIMIVLTVIDALTQFETPWGRWLRRLVTAERIVEWKPEGDEAARIGRVLLSIGWVAGYVVLVYFVGYLISTPIYMFLYMLLHGQHSVLNSALVTVGTTLAIWLTFEVLFKYPLYPGILFGAY